MSRLLCPEFLSAEPVYSRPVALPSYIPSFAARASIVRLGSPSDFPVTIKLDGAISGISNVARSAKYLLSPTIQGNSPLSTQQWKVTDHALGRTLQKELDSSANVVEYSFVIEVERAQTSMQSEQMDRTVQMIIESPETGEVIEFAISLPSEGAL